MIFRGHTPNFKVTRAEKSTIKSKLSKISRPVAAIKSLRFALLLYFNISPKITMAVIIINILRI